ncbi:glycosyltransferase family 4 protein [Halosimplex aquaticum]|uniref:Glycosyltransferase family 4 protein n=1 Tax=Halosimplex aquaticum TaxID=3026162 RepID=A0ABD5XZ45_9EURY|nr:glycosyltransferase [Halosimplex aquaticum]
MPVRVCFVSLGLYSYANPDATDTAGGAERQLYLLSQKFSDSTDVHAVVAKYGQPSVEFRDGITFHRSYSPDPEKSPLLMPYSSIKLMRAMQRADADVYVYRGDPQKASIVAAIAALLGKKFVYNLANDSNITAEYQSLPPHFRHLFGWSLENAAEIIAQTPKQEALVNERFGTDSIVIPNGYPRADEISGYDEREVALWVGRLDQDQKRPHLFLDLVERLPNHEFILIGPRGFDESYCNSIIERANSIDNVAYTGRVDPNEVDRYYRRASVLVNTSAYEGFPNTFLEAWRQGVPIASLDVNPGRYLDTNIAGYANGDIARLKTDTELFLTDVCQRRKVGEKSRRIFESRYTIDTIASKYEETIRKAART